MPIRTKESLQQLFASSRLRQEKKKRLQEQKYKNAQQAVKKALADKLSTKDEKTPQKAQEEQITAISRIITIYNSKYVERFADEGELYNTREELMEAEQRGEGKINWDKFNEIVEQTKQILNNDKGREKRVQ